MPYMFPDVPGMNYDGVRVRPGINQNAGRRHQGRTPYSSLTAPNTAANLDPARAPRLSGARGNSFINRVARPSRMRAGRNLGINMEGFGSTRSSKFIVSAIWEWVYRKTHQGAVKISQCLKGCNHKLPVPALWVGQGNRWEE